MKRNSKITILVFLLAIVAFIWAPKGKKPASVSADTFENEITITTAAVKKRTSFDDWGRDPFIWPENEKQTNEILSLTIYAITWQGEQSEAMIDDKLVRVGDRIAGKTVKRIEKNRVILTDGEKEYTITMK
jgi:hypothetical protein